MTFKFQELIEEITKYGTIIAETNSSSLNETFAKLFPYLMKQAKAMETSNAAEVSSHLEHFQAGMFVMAYALKKDSKWLIDSLEGQSLSEFIDKKLTGINRTMRDLIIDVAAGISFNDLILDKSLFSDAYLNATMGDSSDTVRLHVLRSAIKRNNQELIFNKDFLPAHKLEEVAKDSILDKQVSENKAWHTYRIQALNNAILYDRPDFFKAFLLPNLLDAQIMDTAYPAGFTYRHLFAWRAFDHKKPRFLLNPSFFQNSFYNACAPGKNISNHEDWLRVAIEEQNNKLFFALLPRHPFLDEINNRISNRVRYMRAAIEFGNNNLFSDLYRGAPDLLETTLDDVPHGIEFFYLTIKFHNKILYNALIPEVRNFLKHSNPKTQLPYLVEALVHAVASHNDEVYQELIKEKGSLLDDINPVTRTPFLVELLKIAIIAKDMVKFRDLLPKNHQFFNIKSSIKKTVRVELLHLAVMSNNEKAFEELLPKNSEQFFARKDLAQMTNRMSLLFTCVKSNSSFFWKLLPSETLLDENDGIHTNRLRFAFLAIEHRNNVFFRDPRIAEKLLEEDAEHRSSFMKTMLFYENFELLDDKVLFPDHFLDTHTPDQPAGETPRIQILTHLFNQKKIDENLLRKMIATSEKISSSHLKQPENPSLNNFLQKENYIQLKKIEKQIKNDKVEFETYALRIFDNYKRRMLDIGIDIKLNHEDLLEEISLFLTLTSAVLWKDISYDKAFGITGEKSWYLVEEIIKINKSPHSRYWIFSKDLKAGLTLEEAQKLFQDHFEIILQNAFMKVNFNLLKLTLEKEVKEKHLPAAREYAIKLFIDYQEKMLQTGVIIDITEKEFLLETDEILSQILPLSREECKDIDWETQNKFASLHRSMLPTPSPLSKELDFPCNLSSLEDLKPDIALEKIKKQISNKFESILQTIANKKQQSNPFNLTGKRAWEDPRDQGFGNQIIKKVHTVENKNTKVSQPKSPSASSLTFFSSNNQSNTSTNEDINSGPEISGPK